MSSDERPGDVRSCRSFGVIITNRDRTTPLDACLGSLAAQETAPTWVILSDLGSQRTHSEVMTALAERHQMSYLKIAYTGAWNKSLAFNTAFRLALRTMPAVTHVIQLDADMILHPKLLTRTATELQEVSAFCCAPRMGPPDLETWAVPGDVAGYERMLARCKSVVLARATGVFMVLPSAWLADQRGFDEAYVGWGHEDTEMWWRVRASLTHRKDITGSLLLHQWHPRQPGAGERGPNWPLFVYRMANSAEAANPAGWGNGQIIESVLRPGSTHRPSGSLVRQAWSPRERS